MRLGGVSSASACGAVSCGADQPAFLSRPASRRLPPFSDQGAAFVEASLVVVSALSERQC